jgi:Domain of unknown function (DUF6265)
VLGNRLSQLSLRPRFWRAAGAAILALALVVGRAGTAVGQEKEASAASPQNLPPSPSQTSSKPLTLNDLAWLQGEWTGTWGPRTATQTWSAPRGGTMVGALQIVADDKTTVVEFFTITQTPNGLEYRILHFTPTLAPWEKSGPAMLSLMSSDTRKFVFQNKTDDVQPQQIVFVKNDPDTYTDHSEIARDVGDPLTYDIVFHRQKPSAGSASHR